MNEGLVQAILGDPLDDVPRLVLADWLDENGDPDRAEFIRLQIAHESPERQLALLEKNLHWASIWGTDYACRPNRDMVVEVGNSGSWSATVHMCRGFVSWLLLRPPLPTQLFARELALVAPLDGGIELAGRVPIELGQDYDWRAWHWFRGPHEPESPWFVRSEIFDLIRLPEVRAGRTSVKHAPTKEEACAALRYAVADWCRAQADLPPIKR